MNNITDPLNIIDPNREEIKELIKKKLSEIYANGEEILTAFIAKWGYSPEDIEQVEQTVGDERRWFVRRRDKSFDECIDDIDNLAEKLRNG